MENNQIQDNSMKNIGIVITFAIVLLITGAVVIAKISQKTHMVSSGGANSMQKTAQVPLYNQAMPQTNQTVSPTPNTGTSNQQLDQDLQNVQGNLDKLDTNITNTDQSVTNQSADTP